MLKIEDINVLLKQTNTKTDFNIIADLEDLLIKHGLIKAKEYKNKLIALIQKYKETEITEVRNAISKKARDGDLQAAKLYMEYFTPKHENNGETKSNNLFEVIKECAKEVKTGDIQELL